MASIKDVANKANVSIATVSRYFRGTAKVSPETVTKIKSAAKELNYIPNFFASSLKSTKTNFVCFIVDGIRNSFFNSLIEILEKNFQIHGYHLMLALSYNNAVVLKHNIQMFLSMKTNAFIYIPNTNISNTYSLIQKNNAYPLQLFLSLGDNTDSIVIDDAYGTELAVDYLIKKGYTDIVMIDLANENFFNNRTHGFIRGYEKNGLTPPYANMRGIAFDTDSALIDQVIEDILDNHKRPAIIAVANEIGSKVINHIVNRGLRFKKDVGLIIYDDIEIAQLMNITCIGHNKEELAQGIIETVIEGIDNLKVAKKTPTKKVFMPILIERDSV